MESTTDNNARPTRELAQTALFRLHPEGLSLPERIQITYERAKAIGRAYGLSTVHTTLLDTLKVPSASVDRPRPLDAVSKVLALAY